MRFLRGMLMVLGLGLLAACATNDLKDPPVPLGDFVLGHNIAVGEGAQVPGISRKATPDEWENAIEKAMEDRFGRYEGSRIYNFGLRVDGYVLAPPGVPVVASLRSGMIITIFVFEDATQTLLNPDGKQIQIIEDVSPESFIGSGLTQSKAQQLERMSYLVALAVQKYLLENPEWFEGPSVAPTSDAARTAPPAAPANRVPVSAVPVLPVK